MSFLLGIKFCMKFSIKFSILAEGSALRQAAPTLRNFLNLIPLRSWGGINYQTTDFFTRLLNNFHRRNSARRSPSFRPAKGLNP